MIVRELGVGSEDGALRVLARIDDSELWFLLEVCVQRATPRRAAR